MMPELEDDDESFFGESYDKETDSDYDGEDAKEIDKFCLLYTSDAADE